LGCEFSFALPEDLLLAVLAVRDVAGVDGGEASPDLFDALGL